MEGGNTTADNSEEDHNREQATEAADNANLDMEQPKITFRRRPITNSDQTLIQDILALHRTINDRDEMKGDADKEQGADNQVEDPPLEGQQAKGYLRCSV